MESLENEIEKYKSLLDQKNQELKELQSRYEEAEKERLELRDDFKKVSIYIQNTQQFLDEQDINGKIFIIKNSNKEKNGSII